MSTTKHISIRFPEELAERITDRAQDEGRSFSQMVVRLAYWAMQGSVPDMPRPNEAQRQEATKHMAQTVSALMNHALNCKCLICKPPKST